MCKNELVPAKPALVPEVIEKPRPRPHADIYVVTMTKPMTGAEVMAEMDKHGLRPATIEELGFLPEDFGLKDGDLVPYEPKK